MQRFSHNAFIMPNAGKVRAVDFCGIKKRASLPVSIPDCFHAVFLRRYLPIAWENAMHPMPTSDTSISLNNLVFMPPPLSITCKPLVLVNIRHPLHFFLRQFKIKNLKVFLDMRLIA